jgi:hypothetical protein
MAEGMEQVVETSIIELRPEKKGSGCIFIDAQKGGSTI